MNLVTLNIFSAHVIPAGEWEENWEEIVPIAFAITNLHGWTSQHRQESHINTKNAPIKEHVIAKLASANVTTDMKVKDVDANHARMNAPDMEHVNI